MSKQDEILGKHPNDPLFGIWFNSVDEVPETDYCHRSLSEKRVLAKDEWDDLAQRLIRYHYKPVTIQSLREKYAKLGFPKYANSDYFKNSRRLPNASNRSVVRKGNATEMLMQEYCLASLHLCKDVIFIYRFQYSPNVDQSMKGDDMLLINIADKDNPIFYLGEAKFRREPCQEVLDDINKSFSKGKMPISLLFIKDRLDDTNPTVANLIDSYLEKNLAQYDIRYIGFLLSKKSCNRFVKNHWKSDNPKHLMISLGMVNPVQFMTDLYDKATILLKDPSKIK